MRDEDWMRHSAKMFGYDYQHSLKQQMTGLGIVLYVSKWNIDTHVSVCIEVRK